MDFIFDNDRPIYVQLVETLRTAIVAGEYAPGARLPSVRELSVQAKVSPNTMQRALTQLEEDGLVFTERTNGKFVTREKDRINKVKSAIAAEKARAYLKETARLGLTPAEAVACLNECRGENE